MGSEARVARATEAARRSNDSNALLAASLDLTKVAFEAHLWVLGAYEIVRAISQRKPVGFDKELFSELRDLKRLFTRMRIPLAKFEAASTFKGTDYSIAELIIDPEHYRLGWRTSESHVIARQELSDRLLKCLLHARAKDSRFPDSQPE
jgi:hypothetical protein